MSPVEETEDSIRMFQVNNINYGLTTTASSVFPPGITGELVSRPQVSEFQMFANLIFEIRSVNLQPLTTISRKGKQIDKRDNFNVHCEIQYFGSNSQKR